jgi:hypothetical protein
MLCSVPSVLWKDPFLWVSSLPGTHIWSLHLEWVRLTHFTLFIPAFDLRQGQEKSMGRVLAQTLQVMKL